MLGLPFKNDCILLRASIAVPKNKNYKQCFVNWHLKIYVGTGAGVIKIREIRKISDIDSRKLHILCII